MPATDTTKGVCVVGAGPAGLAAARALKKEGLAFDVFERNPGVGGIWNPDHVGSPIYDSAHFISSKGAPTSTFRGHPFGAEAAVYPSHAQVLAYLRSFAATEGLLSHIQFGSAVEKAVWADSAWRVTVGGRTHAYHSLICASGTLWDPIIPQLAGAETFSGTIRHSVTYRSADEVRNKRILIVGAGNSGADIACDAARSAKSVSLSMRRGYWFVPKFIAGHPADVLLRSRGGLPDWIQPPDAASLLRFLVGSQESYGMEAPNYPPFSAHPIMNSEVLHHMGHGRIRARRAIDRLNGNRVTYVDGQSETADEIILATGYKAGAPYLADAVFDYEGGNRPKLWMRLIHSTHPALYGLGYVETNSSVYRLFDLGAELIAGHIRATLRGDAPAASLNAAIAKGEEPDLSNGRTFVASPRHVGYVDSHAYEAGLVDLLKTHLGRVPAKPE